MDKYLEGAKYKQYLSTLIYVDLLYKKRQLPSLEIANDDRSYTNRHMIHIGTGMLDADDKEELFYDMYFVLGHELQHIHSTVLKDWVVAEKTCERDIANELASRVLKKSVRLVKESDYNKFYKELYENGVLIKRSVMHRIIDFVINSLEDGRIELIREKKHPAFRKYRKCFRGRLWRKEEIPETDPEYSKLTDDRKLTILLNDTLSLATTEMHQKGFLKKYGDSEMIDIMARIIPHIRTAIFAKTCRECMEEGRSIVLILLDTIIEACKATDIEKQILNLMSSLMEALENQDFPASPGEEEEGDGIPVPALFGQSALRKGNSKADSSNGKESDKDEKNDSSDGDKPKDGDDESSDKQESGKSETSAKDGGKEDSGKEDKASAGSSGMDQGSDSSDASSDGKGPDSSSNGESDDQLSDKVNDNEDSKGSAEKTKKGPEDDPDIDAEAEIMKAMEKALKDADPNMKAADEFIEREKKFKENMAKWKSNVSSKPIDTSSINDNYSETTRFTENRRIYTPNVMLPFELQNKGKALKRKIEDALKNQRTPDQRGIRSGSMDGSLIHRLIYSDVSVFKKKGTEEARDIAGYILMDNSGSMGMGEDSTRHYACNAVSVIEEGFSDLMPLKITAFDAYFSDHVFHEVIKDFDEKAPANFTHNFLIQGRSGNGNKDGYSIRVATKELSERPEKDKLLIIASDGLPSDYENGYEEGIKDVRAAVEAARAQGIKLVGLFMYSSQTEDEFDAFKRMYEPGYIICERSEIEDELVRVVKNAFLNK